VTASTGVLITHRYFHTLGNGAFIARPDICADCMGVSVAAAAKHGVPPDERVPHPDNPPTYAELMRRAGTPLQSTERTVFEPTFRDAMTRHGYTAPARPAKREG